MTENPSPRAGALRNRIWQGDSPSGGAAARSDAGVRERRCTAEPRPSFTQTVDGRLGIIRPRGPLTAETGALLRETVEALHRSGHTRVSLDLGGLQGADDAGLDALSALQRWVGARGRSLVLIGRIDHVGT